MNDRRIREIVLQTLRELSGEGFGEEAEFEIPELDQGYSTAPARHSRALENNQTSGSQPNEEVRIAVNAGETVPIDITLEISGLVDQQRTGIVIRTPSTPQDGSGISLNGKAYGPDGYNQSIGALGNGTHHITGVLHNGNKAGIVGILYDEPVPESTETAECEEGEDAIELSNVGNWQVTVTLNITGDTSGATAPYGVVSMGGQEQIIPLPADNPSVDITVNLTFFLENADGASLSFEAFDVGKGDVDAESIDWRACPAAGVPVSEEIEPGIPNLERGSQMRIRRQNDSRFQNV